MAQIVKPALRQARSRQVLMELLAHAGGVYRLSMGAREYKPVFDPMFASSRPLSLLAAVMFFQSVHDRCRHRERAPAPTCLRLYELRFAVDALQLL
jgi:hypothetical protein